MNENTTNDHVLKEAAETMAKNARVAGKAKPGIIARKLRGELETIRESYKKLVYSRQVSRAYEWLFDNYYILEREGRLVIKGLLSTEALPCGGDGFPVSFRHAQKMCAILSGKIDAAGIETYIEAAQRVRNFDSAELASFGLMLRAALIEGAERACSEQVGEPERETLLSDAVKTLNFLTTFDFSEIVERQSRIEQILSRDPAGVYKKMEERSREIYRKRLSEIALRRKMPESDAAELAISLAEKGKTQRERHVGYYIIDRDLDRPKSRTRGRLYLTLLWSIPAVIAIVTAVLLRIPWAALLVYLPLWEILRPITDYFILKGVPATFMPRLDTEGKIPDCAPTLVVISTLLTSPHTIESYSKKIEQFYYSNGQGNILFGILADLKESRLPEQPEDKAIRTSAVKAIKKLNQKYGSRFCVLIRNRRLNKTQSNFSGWERKRGAIAELVRYIKGQNTSIFIVEGDEDRLHKVKYIITLDSDTGLIMDTAAEMVSVAMHPLNRPEIDPEKGIVTKGYGIFGPRIGVDLEAAGITPFSRIMAGNGGVTAYDNAAGDTYQDLFDEGIFAGKGLIDVDAYSTVLDKALPENRILSHDILEGCFMRAGFLSDVELTDGFPPRPGPWFDRLHRWIRGDWQNISYIGGRIETAEGERESPFNLLSKFKIADNLRRSLVPAFAFICLIAAGFQRGPSALTLIIIAILSMSGGALWNALLAVIHGGPSMLSRKFHCRVLPQAVNSIAQGILEYLFLPYHAILSLDGIFRALWRRHTGRDLLEWTTAAESEAKSGGMVGGFWRFWCATVAGIVFLFAAVSPIAKVAGALFIITPFVAWFSGRKTTPSGDELSDDDKETLRSYTAAMWRYYDDYAGAADNYLPPDNVQEAPVHALAHRTSPTNIGLFLLSTLAARDFGLIDSENLYERLERTITTIERMEKWKGHLYNWYETKTLRPMRPAYVSTVDSGNFICCLIALNEGLKDYWSEAPFSELRNRIQKLADDADISILFNRRRKLFHIGYDVEKGELSEIYYDLLMSEARMTSYYAVAKRLVPKRHWGSLGRTLTRQNGYTGPISWTGTMFEYLMPHLLLPVYDDSLAAEALRFVIYCQKRRVRDYNIPWGISESGFYAFDAALNYQYEAHGVQKLALKRGMDSELVISPYSTFIALPFDPTACMKNLKRLEDMGMYGRCGFFEAADFTYKRTEGRMAVVKSYMAHHVGMSIVASANALLNGIMQDRFMRNYQMRSAQDLLQEKIPSNAVVFHDVLRREIPNKPGRGPTVKEVFDRISPVTPRVHMLSNGEYTMVVTDTGASFSMFRGIDLLKRSSDLLRNPIGIYAIADFEKEVISATSAPSFNGLRMVKHSVEFNNKSVTFNARTGSSEITMRALLHSNIPCEARSIEVANYLPKHVNTNLLLYFEPVLAKTADEAAHPAFSRLFLSVSYRSDTKILIFARRPRGTELPAYLAVGFIENEVDFEFETSRTNLLKRPEGITSILNATNLPFENKTGAIPEACTALRVKMPLPARGKKDVTLLFAAANSADEAAARLIEVRMQGFHNFVRNAAGKDGNEIESRLAAMVLPQVLFPVSDGVDRAEAVGKNRMGQSGLWSLGISGDYPIVLFEYASATDLERLEPYIKTHRAMRLKGVQVDLVITFREGGDYTRAQNDGIRSMIRECGSEYLMNARGGVHLVNLNHHPEEICVLLRAVACHNASSGKKQAFEPYAAAPIFAGTPPDKPKNPGRTVYGGYFNADTFVIPHVADNPPAPWCQIFANKTFGTMVSDKALGFTWAINARENKLTPWTNDPVADNRGEMLVLRIGKRLFDLCLNARVTYRTDSATYESNIDGLKCRVVVTVPGNLQAKVVDLYLENGENRNMDLDAAYYMEPVLGVNTSTKRFISLNRKEKALLLRNPWSQVSGNAFMSVPGNAFSFIRSRSDFFSGKWDRSSVSGNPDVCAALIVKKKLPPKRKERIRFVLGWAACEQAAEKMADMFLLEHKINEISKDSPYSDNYIKLQTPDEELNNLVGIWLRHQFVASRIMGKTGFYQCGGAWGFRDQLQDCCAALLLDPDIARSHIFRSAAHQFKEGDVMHWWHQLPPRDGGARGVRTRCSDDLLWLPYTVSEYIEKTGDTSIFEPLIYYLDGPELDRTEEDRYFIPNRSDLKENVYMHCIRAIERASTRGEHEIPLFGSGDWNDGMNLVGIGGRGESVWLAMFLALVLERFAPICRSMKDDERAQRYLTQAQKLKKSVDQFCWNGEWYLRGFYDDGHPLGDKGEKECMIDLLPQSFAAIAEMPDKDRRRAALDSVIRLLEDDRLGIVKLFTPPFDSGNRNPGYIRSYPPGIRENGGQYTHSAIWFALALLIEGRGDDAYRVLSWINPEKRTTGKSSALRYRLEPYAIAADIYANSSCEGRGGWSFYTGAAGWYYRTVIEYMLGIRIRADRIELKPVLPSEWNGFKAEISLRGTEVALEVIKNGGIRLLLDGKEAESIPLDHKKHKAVLYI